MWIPAEVMACLGELGLSADLSEGTLAEAMTALIESVTAAVPTATGVALTVGDPGQRVTISTQAFGAGVHQLVLHLPISAAVLTISASQPMSRADFTSGLPVIPDPGDGGDEDAQAEVQRQLDDVAVINRALGVLLDQGFAEPAAELRRRAGQSGRRLIETARAVVESIPSDDRS